MATVPRDIGAFAMLTVVLLRLQRALRLGRVVGCAGLSVAGAGCLALSGTRREMVDYVSLHEYAAVPRLGHMERPLALADGRVIYVRRIPVLSSAQVPRMDTYAVTGGEGLRLYLNRAGAMRWMAITAEHRGRHLVMLVDGEFRAFVKISGREPSGVVGLDGPFPPAEARRIAASAENNSRMCEPWDSAWN